jgi:hypothetical protein
VEADEDPALEGLAGLPPPVQRAHKVVLRPPLQQPPHAPVELPAAPAAAAAAAAAAAVLGMGMKDERRKRHEKGRGGGSEGDIREVGL